MNNVSLNSLCKNYHFSQPVNQFELTISQLIIITKQLRIYRKPKPSSMKKVILESLLCRYIEIKLITDLYNEIKELNCVIKPKLEELTNQRNYGCFNFRNKKDWKIYYCPSLSNKFTCYYMKFNKKVFIDDIKYGYMPRHTIYRNLKNILNKIRDPNGSYIMSDYPTEYE